MSQRILSFSLVNAPISGQTWVLCAWAEIPDDTTISAAKTIPRTEGESFSWSHHRATGWWLAFWMTTRMFFAAASSVVCAV